MQSYLSPKTAVKGSKTEGKGLFAIKPIKKNNVIGIKSGHIFDEATRKKLFPEIGDSFFPIMFPLWIQSHSIFLLWIQSFFFLQKEKRLFIHHPRNPQSSGAFPCLCFSNTPLPI